MEAYEKIESGVWDESRSTRMPRRKRTLLGLLKWAVALTIAGTLLYGINLNDAARRLLLCESHSPNLLWLTSLHCLSTDAILFILPHFMFLIFSLVVNVE